MPQPHSNSSKPAIKYLAEFKRQVGDSTPKWTRLMDTSRERSRSKTVMLAVGGRYPPRGNRRCMDLQLEQWSPEIRRGYWTLELDGERHIVGYTPHHIYGAKWHKVDLLTGQLKQRVIAYSIPRNEHRTPSESSSFADEVPTDQSSSARASVSSSSIKSSHLGTPSPEPISSNTGTLDRADRNTFSDEQTPYINRCTVNVTSKDGSSRGENVSKRSARSVSDASRISDPTSNKNKRSRVSILGHSSSNSVSCDGDPLAPETEDAAKARAYQKHGDSSNRSEPTTGRNRQHNDCFLQVQSASDRGFVRQFNIGDIATSEEFFDVVSKDYDGDVESCDVARVAFNWTPGCRDLIQLFVYKNDESTFKLLLQVIQKVNSWRSPSGSQCLGTVYLDQTHQCLEGRQHSVRHFRVGDQIVEKDSIESTTGSLIDTVLGTVKSVTHPRPIHKDQELQRSAEYVDNLPGLRAQDSAPRVGSQGYLGAPFVLLTQSQPLVDHTAKGQGLVSQRASDTRARSQGSEAEGHDKAKIRLQVIPPEGKSSLKVVRLGELTDVSKFFSVIQRILSQPGQLFNTVCSNIEWKSEEDPLKHMTICHGDEDTFELFLHEAKGASVSQSTVQVHLLNID